MSQWSKNKMITAQKRKPKLETMWREENNQKETQLRIESDLKEKVGMCTLMEKKKKQMWIYTDIFRVCFQRKRKGKIK
jgi:hypothetical protein